MSNPLIHVNTPTERLRNVLRLITESPNGDPVLADMARDIEVELNKRTGAAFIVTVSHNGQKWPLRGTVWAMSMDRATRHATREAAQAALEKARKFMHARHYKAARIEEVSA